MISQSKTCAAAGQSYFTALGAAGPADSVDAVVVLRAGPERYVVAVPSYREGGFQVIVVFDSKWKALREVSF